MKNFLDLKIFVNYLTICFILQLTNCSLVHNDEYIGVFLNIGAYEKYGDLDIIIVNSDYTYEHIFVQKGETTLNESTWEPQHILGEVKIIFNDWSDYGYSSTVWGSHKPWRFQSTYIHRDKKYVNIPKDNIFDEDYDYYKLSDEEIIKYRIDSITGIHPPKNVRPPKKRTVLNWSL